ncbi:hypothetical protein [Natronorubrum sp. DTA28]|uniref:hypothetical protein n=1 Tax=Natronorubrum sp. DTA28 TaxID=3447019 RepID=UPI003F846817
MKFVENEAGEIVVRPVGSMREFRGLERDGEEERPATAVLRDERERETRRSEAVVETFDDEDAE